MCFGIVERNALMSAKIETLTIELPPGTTKRLEEIGFHHDVAARCLVTALVCHGLETVEKCREMRVSLGDYLARIIN
jgi:hypothetical protein